VPVGIDVHAVLGCALLLGIGGVQGMGGVVAGVHGVGSHGWDQCCVGTHAWCRGPWNSSMQCWLWSGSVECGRARGGMNIFVYIAEGSTWPVTGILVRWRSPAPSPVGGPAWQVVEQVVRI
jgi:hypothetical protein